MVTSADETAFCAMKVQVTDDPNDFLWLDGNSKVTAGNGTLDLPRPNALSLVQVQDCPFATNTCKKSCYVHNLEGAQRTLHKMYQHNSAKIRALLYAWDATGDWGTGELWAMRLGAAIERKCAGGFRWHNSGDILSETHAKWIAMVVEHSQNVNHWIYTRSFGCIRPLLGQRNLTINLSADEDNYQDARVWAEVHKLRIAYMTIDGSYPCDLLDGAVIFPDYALRGGTPRGNKWFASLEPRFKAMVCPVDVWGKADNRRCGPCDRCIKRNGE